MFRDACRACGFPSKSRTPSEHPNSTTKIGSKMDGAPTPKWAPKTVLTHSHLRQRMSCCLWCGICRCGDVSFSQCMPCLCGGTRRASSASYLSICWAEIRRLIKIPGPQKSMGNSSRVGNIIFVVVLPHWTHFGAAGRCKSE